MSRYLRVTIDATAMTEKGEKIVDKLVAEAAGPFSVETLGRRLHVAIENGDIEIDAVRDAEDHG